MIPEQVQRQIEEMANSFLIDVDKRDKAYKESPNKAYAFIEYRAGATAIAEIILKDMEPLVEGVKWYMSNDDTVTIDAIHKYNEIMEEGLKVWHQKYGKEKG